MHYLILILIIYLRYLYFLHFYIYILLLLNRIFIPKGLILEYCYYNNLSLVLFFFQEILIFNLILHQ